jgi:outer membrane protein OmpA-like peptidoglycan-associated protein
VKQNIKHLLMMGLMLVSQLSMAQTSAPSTAEMIEQLKAPAPAAQFKTRGLRNLSVEATPDTASETAIGSNATAAQTPAVRPSLSLLIQFDFNSAQIRPESQQSLMNLAQALKAPELLNSNFAVEGHTDAKGGSDYNLRLSQQRADAVQKFLAQRGVASDRLMAVGKGSTQLANSSDPFAAENRRVRIVNLD